ncbi:hypothetical protein [Stieleria varia]|uniref:Uncharacterized protein n=1 Tax=Stieleria varia TaxID=2528005 RepID=A0A5C5ZVU5_9BACT|nr:hypothetical protein [Stieleria varia]TWT91286.1 hypothetical protein Pla52n_66200 [Stieleria varia]
MLSMLIQVNVSAAAAPDNVARNQWAADQIVGQDSCQLTQPAKLDAVACIDVSSWHISQIQTGHTAIAWTAFLDTGCFAETRFSGVTSYDIVTLVELNVRLQI